MWAGICWEKSYVPLEIWQARRRESNIAEIVHADVNLEGTQCTLVGGVGKGRHFDLLKQRTLKVLEQSLNVPPWLNFYLLCRTVRLWVSRSHTVQNIFMRTSPKISNVEVRKVKILLSDGHLVISFQPIPTAKAYCTKTIRWYCTTRKSQKHTQFGRSLIKRHIAVTWP